MKKPDFTTIHHLAIIVSNYDAARRFYVDILGLPIIRENYRPQKDEIKLDLKWGTDRELEIFVRKNPPPRPGWPGFEAAGLRHLAFRTQNIEETAAYLSNHGIKIEPIRRDEYTGEKMTFFFDPDGLPLELHE